jgi:periplasmic mercuric ion binding protein
MKTLLFITALLLCSAPAWAQQTQTLVVATSAKCDMCKRTLETALIREPGVSSVTLDVKSKQLTLAYNPRTTTPAKLRTAVTNVGYDADSLVANQKAHDRLKPCCRKDAAEHKD